MTDKPKSAPASASSVEEVARDLLALFPDDATIEALKADKGYGYRSCPLIRTPKDDEIVRWRAILRQHGYGAPAESKRAETVPRNHQVEPTSVGARCLCCQSDLVTLHDNGSARWVQCHNPRCGMSEHVSINPELGRFFSPAPSPESATKEEKDEN